MFDFPIGIIYDRDMDMQTILTNASSVMRAERLKSSPQMTLGEMIATIELIAKNQENIIKKYDHEADVVFDFEYAYPTGLSSWRGSYAELALNFSFKGYGVEGFQKLENFEPKEMLVSKFLELLKSALGKEYTGWKGGEFVMGKTTPIWVANDGNSGNTGVVGIKNDEHTIILETQLVEY